MNATARTDVHRPVGDDWRTAAPAELNAPLDGSVGRRTGGEPVGIADVDGLLHDGSVARILLVELVEPLDRSSLGVEGVHGPPLLAKAGERHSDDPPVHDGV